MVEQLRQRLAGWSRSATAWLGREALLLCLLLFTLLVRWFTLEGYALNGDNTKTWEFVRGLAEGGDLHWDHHTTRWGMVLPGVLSFLIVGKAPIAYFLPGLAATLVQSAALYKCGEWLHGRALGFVAVVTLVMFPPAWFSVQLMPGTFAAAGLTVAAYFWLRYWRMPNAPLAAVVGCALALFYAYLAKEPSVLTVPGFALAIWVGHKNWRHVGILLGILLGLFLLETALYALLIDELPLGRYSALNVHHMHNRRLQPVADFWQLFSRYGRIKTPELQLLFYAYVVCSVVVLAGYRFVSRGLWGVTVVAASYYLGMGLAVKSLDPLVPVLTIRDRYFGDATPLMCLVTAGAVAEFLFWSSGPSSKSGLPMPTAPNDSWAARARHWVLKHRVLAVAVPVLAQLSAYTLVFRAHGGQEHPLTQLNQLQRQIAAAYERGDPIVCYNGKPKALYAVRHVLWPYSIGRNTKSEFLRGRLQRPISFLTSKSLPTASARQKYLDAYRDRPVLTVATKSGMLRFRTSVLRPPKGKGKGKGKRAAPKRRSKTSSRGTHKKRGKKQRSPRKR